MEKKQKSEILQKIKQEILETQDKIRQYQELSNPISPDNAIGRVSRMDAINNKSLVEAALRESKQKLSELEIAKNHIKTNYFGICEICKHKIPFGRIMLRPQSRKCVKCSNS